jgi:hypothetical protein
MLVTVIARRAVMWLQNDLIKTGRPENTAATQGDRAASPARLVHSQRVGAGHRAAEITAMSGELHAEAESFTDAREWLANAMAAS